MKEFITQKYTIKSSDSRKWLLIKSPSGLTVDVEVRILDYHYDCIPQQIQYNGGTILCSFLCCYQGCYINEDEIDRVKKMIPEIKSLLQHDAKELLDNSMNIFHIPDDYDKEEKLWKTRCAPNEWDKDELEDIDNNDPRQHLIVKPKNYCIFLMSNGLCAVHKHCSDSKKNWIKNKFNICVTFPLDIRPQDNTLSFMSGFDSFTFGLVNCISKDEDLKKSLKMPQVINSMKYAIVDRYGEEWWDALNAVACDYREGRINLDDYYPNKKSKK